MSPPGARVKGAMQTGTFLQGLHRVGSRQSGSHLGLNVTVCEQLLMHSWMRMGCRQVRLGCGRMTPGTENCHFFGKGAPDSPASRGCGDQSVLYLGLWMAQMFWLLLREAVSPPLTCEVVKGNQSQV